MLCIFWYRYLIVTSLFKSVGLSFPVSSLGIVFCYSEIRFCQPPPPFHLRILRFHPCYRCGELNSYFFFFCELLIKFHGAIRLLFIYIRSLACALWTLLLPSKLVQFSSVQFIQFHQIHYKSERPTGYRTSHSAIYVQILILKIQITK